MKEYLGNEVKKEIKKIEEKLQEVRGILTGAMVQEKALDAKTHEMVTKARDRLQGLEAHELLRLSVRFCQYEELQNG
jgi:hypothetical protein